MTLITGASSGIGADLARVFAREGHDLALVARSGDKLAGLADEIEASGRRRPLLFPLDLTAARATEALAAGLAAAQATPNILVNNAGFGLIGDVAQLNAAEQLAIIDLNIRSLVEITLRFLPQIRATQGKILNVASIASFFPGGPGMAVYYASKAFVLSFSLGLAQELRKRFGGSFGSLSGRDPFRVPGPRRLRARSHAEQDSDDEFARGGGGGLQGPDGRPARDHSGLAQQNWGSAIALCAEFRNLDVDFANAAKASLMLIRA